jgi:hypothetical protein
MRTALLAPIALLVACGPGRATPARSTATATASPLAAPAPAPDPSLARLGLVERLARERAARPTGRPRPEDLMTALAGRGLALEGWKQVLASPVGARFCMAGRTRAGLGVAVCEYASGAEAAAGQRRSRAAFDHLIPDRSLEVKGTALLTVTRPIASAAVAREAQAVTATFSAL